MTLALEEAAEEARLAFLDSAELELAVDAEVRDRDEAEAELRKLGRLAAESEATLRRAEAELQAAEEAVARASPSTAARKTVERPPPPPPVSAILAAARSSSSSSSPVSSIGRRSLVETAAELDVMRRDAADRALEQALGRNQIVDVDGRLDVTNCCGRLLERAIAEARAAASTRCVVKVAELVAEARAALSSVPPNWGALRSPAALRAAADDLATARAGRRRGSADVCVDDAHSGSELLVVAAALETRAAVEALFEPVAAGGASLLASFRSNSPRLVRAPRTAALVRVVRALMALRAAVDLAPRDDDAALEAAVADLEAAVVQLDHLDALPADTDAHRAYADVLDVDSAPAARAKIRAELNAARAHLCDLGHL